MLRGTPIFGGQAQSAFSDAVDRSCVTRGISHPAVDKPSSSGRYRIFGIHVDWHMSDGAGDTLGKEDGAMTKFPLSSLQIGLIVSAALGAGASGALWSRKAIDEWHAPAPQPPVIETPVVAPSPLAVLPRPFEIRPARTVAYFLDHQDEMESVLRECNNNPGQAGAECVNADDANSKAAAAKFQAFIERQFGK